jgi:putative ubiquitin-RnfH superfamily antitoxin RatB of RatAB toxin-antitoxin module
LLGKHPEIDVKKNKFGIWNKLSKLDAVLLRDKDRIEIYRPLIADPKEAQAASGRRQGHEKRRRGFRRLRGLTR